MQMIWFYVAIVLAISDILHTTLMWKVLNNFYILLGVFIQQSTHSTWQTWVIHEIMEAAFHFIILSIVFLNPTIGLLAALIHFVIDVSHTVLIRNMGELEHRALHFVVESLFFILIYGL
ncbi:hypothetical protein SAMN05216439_1010 [Methanobrevibacter gottschalkii]|uniref:DUF3307 domain-containing protein n=2 Tax=Methanobrevibacter gottschalkii TaxID=190974 RepID=A0A3N5B0X2_9EURY|nr:MULTISPECIES: hypothetical protein [Methanobrevibacter]MCQ2971640.1 hypothetical protein [archaeon]OED00615.1 hypothetical protein A9505_02805 [Methanobrevibacter sp. A27]RPF50809.1 hypothetical protein EDC42_1465 [Methanobrevibacter gottschalkii DSM 11977]SEK47417.1 hypothetical protein SAMN05216439_1010 [Methanobrevibacter gottschalkii]